MKQHITTEQWDELAQGKTIGEMAELLNLNLSDIHEKMACCIDDGNFHVHELVTGMKLIEILDSFKQYEIIRGHKWWVIPLDKSMKIGADELVDALWDAVKEVSL